VTLQTGQILNNRYRIVKLLGQGGFGAVYRAWDMNMDCPRAVKENLDTSPEAQKQFKVEAQILGGLKHANLPLVIDHFILPGQGQYLVMEYVEGEDLQVKLNHNRGPLPEQQVLPWIEQVCEALTYLHNQKTPIIHRDIKPANIKITPDGKAMLVDFGIAKVYDPILSTTIGARGITPGYSPPEQYGQGSTDTRSDVYALGATLYAMLTNTVPADSVDIMTGGHPTVTEAASLNPLVSPKMNAAVAKAMQLNRQDRFQSIEAFRTALRPQPAVTTPSFGTRTPIPSRPIPAKAQPPSGSKMITIPVGKGWLPWVAGFGILIMVLIAIWLGGGPEPLPTKALINPAETSLSSTLTPLPTKAPITPILPSSTPLPPNPTIPALSISSTQVSSIDGMVLMYIPKGEFQMGSAEGDNDEAPVHTVYLDAYWMDQTEVTNAMYLKCVTAGSCDLPHNIENYNNSSYADHPVVYVSWYDAQEYCQWAGRRLPTEAEWEKAARGDLIRKKYPWGDEAPVCTPGAQNGAQYSSCDGQIVPVKTFSPNGYGLFDMAGNVWEWVIDRYQDDYYTSSPANNPLGPASGEARVLRGGGWSSSESYLRVAYRDSYFNLVSGLNDVGFRCVVEPGS
jgi:formylglycine-generating enzyme required for sulfatase activity/predicted Ser/Thr protein kinase